MPDGSWPRIGLIPSEAPGEAPRLRQWRSPRPELVEGLLAPRLQGGALAGAARSPGHRTDVSRHRCLHEGPELPEDPKRLLHSEPDAEGAAGAEGTAGGHPAARPRRLGQLCQHQRRDRRRHGGRKCGRSEGRGPLERGACSDARGAVQATPACASAMAEEDGRVGRKPHLQRSSEKLLSGPAFHHAVGKEKCRRPTKCT
mmetsp:Transcript_90113/g.263475  ORF Transcript_90113/g.263475 Transcript_90113/m.263475 type:complete len:200 (+) Transcript_90113:820-1419(+)